MPNSLKNNPAIGDDVLEFLDSVLTEDEIDKSNKRIQAISDSLKEKSKTE